MLALGFLMFTSAATGIAITAINEHWGNPIVNGLLPEFAPNLEGKEVRFGWARTALWAVAITGTMCGAVNGMHAKSFGVDRELEPPACLHT